MAATTDPVLHDQQDLRLSNGKYVSASVTYNRSDNKLYIHMNTVTPFLFAAARSHVHVTVYGQSPWGGESPMWR